MKASNARYPRRSIIGRRAISACVLLLSLACAGCHTLTSLHSGHSLGKSGSAEQQTQRACQLIESCDYCGAEAALLSALRTNPFYAPAHNNLGELYFKQAKYHAAAMQFQRASNLAPENHKPIANLGLVHETVGRFHEAVEQYRMARELAPNDPDVLGNLARTKVRAEEFDDELAEALHALMLYETRPDWRRWAEEQLSSLETSQGLGEMLDSDS